MPSPAISNRCFEPAAVVNIQALRLGLRRVIVSYVSASGLVLPWWLSVVSGMIAGCVRCAAAGGAVRVSIHGVP